MRRGNRSDLWAGALFLVAGLGAVWEAVGAGVGGVSAPGPGLLPLAIGAALAVLGALLLFKALTLEPHDAAPASAGVGRAVAVLLLSLGGGAAGLALAGGLAGLAIAGVVGAFGWPGLGNRRAVAAGLLGAGLAALAAVAGAALSGASLGWVLPW